ncbi:MAG: classical family protein [Chloroflexi bacterium]|jgi:NAD(P)-dependent dehydrogenase (short-subunit alcohol dehydrogenase family)|nr:classical family protein [Chloroflexota bacterium]
MGGELAGRTILVTGGSGDLGSAAASLLDAHGAVVAVADLHPPSGAAGRLLGTSSSGPIRYFPVDVRRRLSVEQLFSALDEAGLAPDTIICNAGFVHNASFLDVSDDDWEQTLSVNLTGCFLVGQVAARRMVAAGTRGRILMTGSWVQDIPWTDGTSYCTSKSGLKMLARCMARDLAPYGIRVNTIAPGIVNAGLSRQVMDEDPLFRERALRAIPLGELQSPEQVAQAMLWACLPAADYMTGATLLVDGGCSLYAYDASGT